MSYHVKKHNLQQYSKCSRNKDTILTNEFEVIDTPQKAYILGFILGDGCIAKNQLDLVEISIAYKDKEVLEYIAKNIKANINFHMTLNRKTRTFPHCSIVKKIPHITKHLGGRLKPERHYPRVRKDLQRYLLQGFFEADGCVTWGIRKDRSRIWQKISFTHHSKCLIGLQTFLSNVLNISTKVLPKSHENAFVLTFCKKENVLKFLQYIYPDKTNIVLKRKYDKYIALRLKSEENGEGSKAT